MLAVHTIAHDSALGRWVFHESRPPALAGVVDAIWEVEGTVANTRERIFPSAAVDLLINLGPPQTVLSPASAVMAPGTTWLSGMQRGPLLVESLPRVHLFSIRFRPAGAAAVVGTPMSGVSRLVVPLTDVRKGAAIALRDAVQRAPSFEARLLAACAWIERQQAASSEIHGYVRQLADRITAAHGGVPIEVLRRACGVSRKKLAADFKAQVGVTPKLLARIVRFRQARAVLQRPGASVSQTAVLCGYFDQAHMNRDFRDLGRITPQQFLASCYPDGSSAVVEAETFVQACESPLR